MVSFHFNTGLNLYRNLFLMFQAKFLIKNFTTTFFVLKLMYFCLIETDGFFNSDLLLKSIDYMSPLFSSDSKFLQELELILHATLVRVNKHGVW